jgi:cobalt-zinc-cadmium resistance protein CzcA
LSAIEYENGEISYVEYVNAIEETIAVLMKHADAINEYNQAVIAIQRLTGMM